MARDIYELADEINEQWNRYHPQGITAWKTPRLFEFDGSEVGTKTQLEERRTIFEIGLDRKWREYQQACHRRQAEVMQTFKEYLAGEFFSEDTPDSITDRVYGKAWEEGHSSGLRDVVNCYGDLASFVNNILSDYVTHQDGKYQEELLKGQDSFYDDTY